MSCDTDFLDKELPESVDDAIKHVQEHKKQLLEAFDRHVLRGYDPALTVKYSLKPDSARCISMLFEDIRIFESHKSPEQVGEEMMKDEETRYLLRDRFVGTLQNYELFREAHPESVRAAECTAYEPIFMYRMLAGIIKEAKETR